MALRRLVSEQARDRELFLFGDSLGGLIASHYGPLHADQLQGVVLTAPDSGSALRAPRVVDACARGSSSGDTRRGSVCRC